MDDPMDLKVMAATASEEEDDAASVEDVMSTQESAKEDEDDDVDEEEDDMEEEEMEMTEEDDDEDLEMTEEELLDDDTKPAPSVTAKGKRAGGLSRSSGAAAGKRVKKKVRISDVSTVHGGGGGASYNDDVDEDEEDEDERESTAEEDDFEEDEDEFEEEDDERKRKQDAEAQALKKIELSDSASMLRMVQSLPEQEARRHEQFRRSHFERGAIKRCMAKVIQECSAADKKVPSVNNVMAIVMAGMTKVFVGEITAEARRIMEKNGEMGPIRPRHLREAHRKYYTRRPLARGRNLRRLFR